MTTNTDPAVLTETALAKAWNEWRAKIDATERFNKPMEIAFAAGWRAAAGLKTGEE